MRIERKAIYKLFEFFARQAFNRFTFLLQALTRGDFSIKIPLHDCKRLFFANESYEQLVADIFGSNRPVEITKHADHLLPYVLGTDSLNLTETSFETPSSSIVTP